MNIQYVAMMLHDMMLEVYKNDDKTKENLEIYINILKEKIAQSHDDQRN